VLYKLAKSIKKRRNLRKTYIEFLISFLSGVSWALVVLGAVLFFFIFSRFGFFTGLLCAFIGAVFGLFMVLIVEIFSIQIQKLEELKRQTKLLEKLLEKKSPKDDIVSDN
jgi:energy-converting hydrogenase Eha subunit G